MRIEYDSVYDLLNIEFVPSGGPLTNLWKSTERFVIDYAKDRRIVGH